MRPTSLLFPKAALALLALAATRSAQASPPLAGFVAASGTVSSSTEADFPTAPSATLFGDGEGAQAGSVAVTPQRGSIARKYQGIILPGQAAQPLTGGQKVTYAFVQSVSPFNILAWGVSSAYSQAVDSAPHYGQGWGPYGQRYGAAAARGTMQTLATDAVFAPLFHDDPRYYELGRQHKFLNRGIYAASRVVITRSDSGKQRINFPLLAGYAVAAGGSNLFYPGRDRSGSQTAESYGSSLGGAALGFLTNEFLDDALHLAHLRK